MRKITGSIMLFVAFSLILSACANAASTPDAGQAATQAAQVEAQVATRVAQAMAGLEATQKAQTTPPLFIPTVGDLPTLSPLNLPTVSLPGVATSVPCNPPPNNLGETYPDGTSIYINTTFNKSWTLQNAGTCTWNANYKIKFVSGNAMSGPAFKLFGASVPPGGSLTLTLPLKSPGAVGTTTGRWGLYDDKDVYFGWVSVVIHSITVPPTSTAFAVSTLTITQDPSVLICKFSAAITANGAGQVTYTWNQFPGVIPPSETPTALNFAGATTTTVYSPDLPLGTTTAVSIHILPNGIEWVYPAASIISPCIP